MKTAREVVRPDERGRITLGRRARGISGYAVEEREDGSFILTPLAEIPAREKWLWDNQLASASVQRGLEQSSSGKSRNLGGFAKYLSEDDG